jgi:hypothetical protein
MDVGSVIQALNHLDNASGRRRHGQQDIDVIDATAAHSARNGISIGGRRRGVANHDGGERGANSALLKQRRSCGSNLVSDAARNRRATQ